MNHPMTPLQIKRALEDAGHTQADIATSCNVSRSAVNQVIWKNAPSHNIRSAIAMAIGLQVKDIWATKPDTTASSVSS